MEGPLESWVAKQSDASILGGRFQLAIKNTGSSDEKSKARHIAQGHNDNYRPYVVYDALTLRACSVRRNHSVAAVEDFRVFSHDLNQAYVQSKDKLTSQMSLLPREEDYEILDILIDKPFKLILPLYGIFYAGDYWGVAVAYHVEEDLEMSPSLGDPTLHMTISNGVLREVVGIHIDDNLHAGNSFFENGRTFGDVWLEVSYLRWVWVFSNHNFNNITCWIHAFTKALRKTATTVSIGV